MPLAKNICFCYIKENFQILYSSKGITSFRKQTNKQIKKKKNELGFLSPMRHPCMEFLALDFVLTQSWYCRNQGSESTIRRSVFISPSLLLFLCVLAFLSFLLFWHSSFKIPTWVEHKKHETRLQDGSTLKCCSQKWN